MDLKKINQTFQDVGKFFDRAFKSLTFSNVISCIAGALIMMGLSVGSFSVIFLIGGFFLFLSSGLFLADKEDAFFLADMKEELRADLRKIRQQIEEEHRKAAESVRPKAPIGETAQTRVQVSPTQLPVFPPRRRVSSRLNIVEEPQKKTSTSKEEVSPSTPPRPRRKTGA